MMTHHVVHESFNHVVHESFKIILKRFMNHMMSHHSYMILYNHTKSKLLSNVIVRQ